MSSSPNDLVQRLRHAGTREDMSDAMLDAAVRIELLEATLAQIVDMPLGTHDAYLSAVRLARGALEGK